MQQQRILGFDLARAYAIFGMYIVNFNIVFGNHKDTGLAAKFLSLFNGNSSTVFVMLAGMGVALMTNRSAYGFEEQKKLKSVINKRGWFLFGLGLALYVWWPADILHFYGGYMHVGALLIFVHRRYYLLSAVVAIVFFHVLLLIIPYETGWNFNTLQYQDFWTIEGFLRNTFYNGWNPIFPWIAYFTVGMYLGRLDWSLISTQKVMFLVGASMYLAILNLQMISNSISMNDDLKFYVNADYLPPFLPFMISTIGFGLMLITTFIFTSKYITTSGLANDLAKTGQMTLTHYVSHLTIGMIIFSLITKRQFEGKVNDQVPIHPMYILMFATVYFAVSYYFSKIWARAFKHGPFEILMRKISG
jgi:uncharacterized protein